MADGDHDGLEPGRTSVDRGFTAGIKRSDAWRSMFRHAQLDTPRGRALQSFSNFFLHVYPVKVPARVLRLRYSFRLGFIAAALFGILLVTLGLSFTGYLLPWDQLSYWAVTVGTNLVHYVPLVGSTLQDLLIGGDQ